MTKDERRTNRKHVLDALIAETGSFGGSTAEPRVKAYIAAPLVASTTEFAFVGALTLRRFYIDPNKPSTAERRSLWQALLGEFDGGTGSDPGGWDGETNVSLLQAIVEEALELS